MDAVEEHSIELGMGQNRLIAPIQKAPDLVERDNIPYFGSIVNLRKYVTVAVNFHSPAKLSIFFVLPKCA